jgi:hypothetical protein
MERKVWHQLLRAMAWLSPGDRGSLMAMGLAGVRRGKTTITTVSNPKAPCPLIKSIASSALNVPTHCGWSIYLRCALPSPHMTGMQRRKEELNECLALCCEGA